MYGQQILNDARQRNGRSPQPRAAGEIATAMNQRTVPAPIDDSQIESRRHFEVIGLDQFRFGHLNDRQATQLRGHIAAARDWLAQYPFEPALSMVLAGPVGTGKTTIATNILRAFVREVRVQGSDDAYHDLLRRTIASLDTQMAAADDEHRQRMAQQREALVAILDADAPDAVREIVDGRIVDATELMAILGEDAQVAEDRGAANYNGHASLSHSFGRYAVVVVDDVGEEDIPFSGRQYDIIRQRRYGRFLEYCSRAGKHVVLTTNLPLVMTHNGRTVPHPELVATIGQRGFSRLNQMAGGYMLDFTGLPDYRPLLVRK